MENFNKEIWKPVVGYEGYYEVSNLGRVRSVDRWIDREDGYRNHIIQKIRKQKIMCSGYLTVGLHYNNAIKNYLVHRLVAQAFIPNPDNLPCVNHKDEDKLNNCVDNLEWCTYKYNNHYNNLNIRVGLKRKNGKLAKKVLQYDLQGNFIKEWPSTIEITRQTGMCCQSIGQVCLGKEKTAYGYIWKYQ